MTPEAARTSGWGLLVISVALSAVAVAIGTTTYEGPTATTLVVALAIAIALTSSLIGALILSQRPDNGLGWVFALGGVVAVATSNTQEYAADALAADAGSSTGRVAAWVTDIANPVSLALLTVFVFLLFPQGRFERPARRRTAIVALAGIVLSVTGAILEPTLQAYGDTPAPFAPAVPPAIPWGLLAVGYTLLTAALVASLCLLVGRLRRAVGRERDQLRLLVTATATATVLLIPALVAPSGVPWTEAAYVVGGLGLLLIPVSVGVAILRHHLFDIDLVIRRTVIVGILGAFITAVYVGVVVGIGALVGSSGNAVLSAIAAALVALAFQPVLRRARTLANRLVYGDRASPYDVMHTFSERVAGSYRTEDVLPRMASILGEGIGAERAQVWLRVGAELRPAAIWPQGAERSGSRTVSGSRLPEIADVSHAVPVLDGGELLGALSVTKAPSDPMSPAEERLVGDLAHQAGLVMRNVQLVEDLRASRGRLVAAQDEERRRIERDIHDGAQQHLVGLAVKVALADRAVDADAESAHTILAEVREEAQEALDTLRDLARGIYPPLLADEGLGAALASQARKSPLSVEVLADHLGRYPREVEATAYFCCLEAMQNAAKYSSASSLRVVVGESDGVLRFEVRDDGRGFDPEGTHRGSGLQNVADRLDALGGTVELASSPGDGTVLIGCIPLGGT
jgi:signal transduction histidine kinase